MGKKANERFEVLRKEGSEFSYSGKRVVMRDKETGVNYLCVNGHAVTPLVDAYGKPLTSSADGMQAGDRFARVLKEGSEFSYEGKRTIIQDKLTGVCYLVVTAGYGTSVTPLVDADGRPVTMIANKEG